MSESKDRNICPNPDCKGRKMEWGSYLAVWVEKTICEGHGVGNNLSKYGKFNVISYKGQGNVGRKTGNIFVSCEWCYQRIPDDAVPKEIYALFKLKKRGKKR